MGNCGFTLAPCGKPERSLVVRNLERAEDIAAEAMDAGIDWTWRTFPEFLDRVQGLPKGINYAGYIGHSALRTYVMGERAFEKEAGEDDLRAMERELRDAIRAGAIGFTTSRSPSHETPDRRPVASRLASWDEVRRLVGVMGEMNAGIFELAGERTGGDPERLREYHVRLRDLAVESGRPITWGLFSRREEPDLWRTYLALLEETAARGGRMFAQVHSRALTIVLSFKTSLPFDRLPVWRELRALPLDQQKRQLRDPEQRRRLVAAARERDERRPVGAEPRAAAYDWTFVMDTVEGPHRSVAEVARERAPELLLHRFEIVLARDLVEGALAHDVGAQGRVTHVPRVVDALGQRLERVEELGVGGPRPLDAGLHGLRGDVLGALEVADDEASVRLGARGEREAAIAHDDAGDAVPAGGGAERVPEDLGVHVGVPVDEAGRDDLAVGVDDLARRLPDAANAGDAAALDADVGAVLGQPGAIHHPAVLDHEVIGH